MNMWSVNGYGICTDSIETTTEKMNTLLRTAPLFEFYLKGELAEKGVETPELDDYLDFEIKDFDSGYSAILREVIKEAEDIELCVVNDCNGNDWLLFCPIYPWNNATDAEKNLTEEKMEDIFRKYVSILTDLPIEVDYVSAEMHD